MYCGHLVTGKRFVETAKRQPEMGRYGSIDDGESE